MIRDRKGSQSGSARRFGMEQLESRVLLAAGPLAAAPLAGDAVAGEFDQDSILVHFKQNPAGLNGGNILAGTRIGNGVGRDHRLHLVHLGRGVGVDAAIRAYSRNPNVDYAEQNWIYSTMATSNDPYYTNGNLWGMYGDQSTPANQFGSQAGEAWAAGQTGSSDVYVGIIDEGVDINHPELSANSWANPYDAAGDGLDNDGNGYVDDVHGWDFYSHDNSVYDGTGDDHGTHVAGTIDAKGGNGAGVAGIAWNVKYIVGKFLGPQGGSTADAISAIDYMTDLKVRHGLNIVALNNSWGGGGFSQSLLDAITRAARQNILFIAAAGNGGSDQVGDNNDSVASYPSNYDTTSGAGYDSVVAVAAINSTGGLASFSNYGARTVDLGAPGVSIYSTYPGGSYASYSGTSMATPHVTGAAALYASAHPGTSAAAIKNALLSSATPTSSLTSRTVTGGRLNVAAAIQYTGTVTAPAAPSALSASATSSTSAQLSWTDNATNESGFRVERSTDGSTYAAVATLAADSRSYVDNSLTGGRTYYYRVYAYNSAGNSAYSNVASATTPAGVPNGTGTGLTGAYYDYVAGDTSVPPTTALAFGNLKFTRVDPQVSFNWGKQSPSRSISRDTYAVRWTGQIESKYAERYVFTVAADDGARLWIDGNLVIDGWRIGSGNLTGAYTFTTTGRHDIQLDYFENVQSSSVQLNWESPSQARQVVPQTQLYPTTSAPIYAMAAAQTPAAVAVQPAAGTPSGDLFSSTRIDALGNTPADVLA